MVNKFVKFPSIEKFSDVNAMVKRSFILEERPTITYKGKVKLHGTNSAIRVSPEGLVTGQKRTSDVSIGSDNAGFASWLETVKNTFSPVGATYVIFGEWAGPGIQKKVAISSIEKKSFFPFAVYFPETNVWVFEPENIKLYVLDVPDVYVLPWAEGTETTIDFRLQGSMEDAMARIGDIVDLCDKNDPFVKETFGIDGIGEGYVFYPTDTWLTKGDALKFRTSYMFKAKGKSHSVAAHETTNRIQVDPAILDGAAEFAKNFVTQARCEQGLTEACDGTASTANIGKFMAWIGPDVKKESINELEASGLEWKYVAKAVNQQARDWFIRQIDKQIEEAA